MKHYFEVAPHKDTGELGFLMKGMPHFDPGDGRQLAHDMLEHFKNDGGRLEDELMAIGASFLIRGENYYHYKGTKFGICVNAASDFPYVFNEHMDREFLDPPNQKKKKNRLHPRFAEDAESLPREIIKAFEDSDEPVPAWCAPGETGMDRVMYWMNQGYVRAIKRYETARYRGVDMCMFFIEVEEAINKMMKHIYEGQELMVHITPATGTINELRLTPK